MKTALIIVHLIISLVLIVIVLLQHGKQAGLSGAVAGGAETFFGKNKGRTVDAILRKITSVVAILFIISSLTLAYVATRPEKETNTAGAAVEGSTVNVGDDAANAEGGDAQSGEGEEAPQTEAPAAE